MRRVTVFNPAAGKGKKKDDRPDPETQGTLSHFTEKGKDALEFIREECIKDPDTLFEVYGGDGTLCESANGIFSAHACEKAVLTLHPCGSGNDFVRNFPQNEPKEYSVDLIDLGNMVGVNMINIGFDCSVVAKSESIRKKRFVSGSASYLLGVLAVLAGSYGIRLDVETTDAEGKTEKFDGEFLLCVIANGGYCGGGFFAAPAAKTDDGLLDVMMVRKISRPRFLSLIGDYKAGRHIDLSTLSPIEKFSDIMVYKRCKSIRVGGMEEICVDGEVIRRNAVTASVRPHSLRFLYPVPAGDEKPEK